MTILFGPAGIGKVKDIDKTLAEYSMLGIKAAEIPFTYGIFIKKKEDIEAVRKASEKHGIRLSIHAPYWINLNSKEKIKIEESKKRILDCCEIGHKLGVERVVFHPGFYVGMSEQETYENIKNAILEINKVIYEKKWKVKLCPETMGKINVFGSKEQIAQLVKETKCSFCLDFAHILARDKKVDYVKIKELFGSSDFWHCHFSGIEYGEKGERKHKKTEKDEWTGLLKNLPKDKNIVIINESPSPFEDALEGLKVYEK